MIGMGCGEGGTGVLGTKTAASLLCLMKHSFEQYGAVSVWRREEWVRTRTGSGRRGTHCAVVGVADQAPVDVDALHRRCG